MFSRYGILLVCCLIVSICPASAIQMGCVEGDMSPSMDGDVLEGNVSFCRSESGLEGFIVDTSYTEDIEQLHPKIDKYVDKLYGEKFYTCGGIILAILAAYDDLESFIFFYFVFVVYMLLFH